MILAINTAFMTANLALCLDDGKTFLQDVDAKAKHSEMVLPCIDQLFQQAQASAKDLDVVAVVVGPGSFTGLRIGTAIAKALGCANKDLKFLTLSSLELLAYINVKQNHPSEDFLCALNALSGKVFVAEFDKNGRPLGDEKMTSNAEFLADGRKKCVLDGDLRFDANAVCISCEDLLQFALEKQKAGKFVTAKEMLPKYIRLSQAEDELQKKSEKDV